MHEGTAPPKANAEGCNEHSVGETEHEIDDPAELITQLQTQLPKYSDEFKTAVLKLAARIYPKRVFESPAGCRKHRREMPSKISRYPELKVWSKVAFSGTDIIKCAECGSVWVRPEETSLR